MIAAASAAPVAPDEREAVPQYASLRDPIISCGGGVCRTNHVCRVCFIMQQQGIFFFWMLGVMKYIATRYDVTNATLLGASAGGLISVLAACQVDLDTAVERAYQLSIEADLWQRPLGVVGVWGGLIRRWLDDLLPEDAHLLCARVRLVATELPSLQQVYLQVGVHSPQ